MLIRLSVGSYRAASVSRSRRTANVQFERIFSQIRSAQFPQDDSEVTETSGRAFLRCLTVKPTPPTPEMPANLAAKLRARVECKGRSSRKKARGRCTRKKNGTSFTVQPAAL